jgi:NAD(P)-dependent dehydrogenase (short-subunit alcohol dehydrogenase family)
VIAPDPTAARAISIDGVRVLVTGGARGIGAAAVSVLAACGARVVSFDVVDAAGRDVAENATSTGPGTAVYRHVDVARRTEVVDSVQWAVSELGGLDGLLNIAGIERRTSIEDMTEDDLEQVLAVNLKGTVFMCQAALSHLRVRGGSIVNFGSDAGLKPYPLGAHYSSSKAAVMAFTRCAAHEWGSHGIRVNSVAPVIWTPMYDEYRARLTPEELSAHDVRRRAEIPLGGQQGDPVTDLAPVLVFLLSDASKFITGQIIAVNGGSLCVR